MIINFRKRQIFFYHIMELHFFPEYDAMYNSRTYFIPPNMYGYITSEHTFLFRVNKPRVTTEHTFLFSDINESTVSYMYITAN
jgi:hypothetical protein